MNVQANVHECSSKVIKDVEKCIRLLVQNSCVKFGTLSACHKEKLLLDFQKLTLFAASFDAKKPPVFIEKMGEDKHRLCRFERTTLLAVIVVMNKLSGVRNKVGRLEGNSIYEAIG